MKKEFAELKVGKEFTLGSKKMIVKKTMGEPDPCVECFFYDLECNCDQLQKNNIIPRCSAWNREDNKSVIFKEIEE